MECNVCFETTKKSVKCHFCDYTTCTSCASRYILEVTINAACMNCKKPWNREILMEKFGKTFITKKYKAKRENDLFETEKALLPETQPYATAKREMDELNQEISKLHNRLKELKRRKQILIATGGVSKITVEKLAKLTIKCPCDECRGYVDSDTMKCGVCTSNICKECYEKKEDEGHTCDPNTVETVKMMKKDTKNCPKCKVGIHKIEGCDQMYCVQCHTAFSWRTGEIVIGHIHNPHYYEYLRRTGGGEAPRREIGDIPCGGLPTIYYVSAITKDKEIHDMHMNLTHIEREEMRNYRTNRIENNRDIRIDFLNNKITEKQFKTTLQRREKEMEKKQEILQVLNTCVVIGSEIFRRNSRDMKREFQELRDFTNESMRKISKLYNCVVPVFDRNVIMKKKF